MTQPLPELFHAIPDADSADVRNYVSKNGLEEKVRFRNLHYDEVKADLTARGGSRAPALWDGIKLIQDKAEILSYLKTLIT